MLRVAYFCHYDGVECDRVIPKIDEKGVVIEPTQIDKKARGISESSTCWEACDKCPRNFSLGGGCYGRLRIKY